MDGWWSWWPPAARRLLSVLHLQAFMPQVTGGENSAELTAAKDIEKGAAADTDVEGQGAANPTPTTPATAASDGGEDEERRLQLQVQTLESETSGSTPTIAATAASVDGGDDEERRLRLQTLEAETSRTSCPSEVHHPATGEPRMDEGHTRQLLEERGRTKRIYEYTKKVVSYDLIILAAVCNKRSDYFKIWALKVAVAMLLLSFFTDFLCGLLIQCSCYFLTEYPIYLSSFTQMLMPLFLFFSFGELHPYIMIFTALMVLFTTASFHLACFRAGKTTHASKLDHIFDMSAQFYALSTGSVLIIAIVISEKPVGTSPLACSLFLTIFIARYLMLITTMHTPGLVEHAETLMYLLKLLVTSTAILVALELLGYLLAIVAISIGLADVVLTCMPVLIRGRTTNKDKEATDQRKDEQLLAAVMVAIPFVALTQINSEHYTTQDSKLVSAAKLRMLLYFVPLMCSLNRMLISLGGVGAPRAHTAARVLSALEWVRASIVVVAVMDMIYKFSIALILV